MEQDDIDIEWVPADGVKNNGGEFIVWTFTFLVVLTLSVVTWTDRRRGRCIGTLTACKSNLKNIGTAYEMYSTDWSGKYPPRMSLLAPNYLKTLPECPAAGRVTYRATTGATANNNPNFEDYYYVECHGSNHKAVSVTANYPAYDGISGLIERP